MKRLTLITNRRGITIMALLLFAAGLLIWSSLPQKTGVPVPAGSNNDNPAAGEEDLVETFFPDTGGNDGLALGVAGEQNYFVEYRLQRDRLRSQEIEQLNDLVNKTNTNPEVRKKAQERLLELSSLAEVELQVENLIKAKGYEDVAIFIQPATVMVVVSRKELSQQDSARVGDMVSRVTGRKLDDIVIVPKA